MKYHVTTRERIRESESETVASWRAQNLQAFEWYLAYIGEGRGGFKLR